MISKIESDKCNTIDNTYEIEAVFANYQAYIKARNFICELNREEIKQGNTSGISNIDREAMGLPPIKKPQGMLLLAKSNDTMLDVARNVVKAVETTIEVPTGLRSLTVNREQETKDRIQELIGYLNNYVEWR